MKTQSIHEVLKGRIKTFPVYKVNNLEYTIYPTDISIGNILSHEERICFELDTSKRIIDIPKIDLIKISNKIKKFLLNHFDKIIEYDENWDRDNICFTITYFYTGD